MKYTIKETIESAIRFSKTTGNTFAVAVYEDALDEIATYGIEEGYDLMFWKYLREREEQVKFMADLASRFDKDESKRIARELVYIHNLMSVVRDR